MTSVDLFLSFEGRLDRARWLGAAFVLALAFCAAFLLAALIQGAGLIRPGGAATVMAVIGAVLAVPFAAIDWKRFQDLGQPGLFALAWPLASLLDQGWERLGPGFPPAVEHSLGMLIFGARLILVVWYVTSLAGRSGEAGTNRYGADPLGPPLTAPAAGA